MAYGFGWVREGALAGMARPSADAWPWLASEGISAVLSLTVRPPPGDPRAQGLDWLHVPVQDFTAPTPEELQRCLGFIDRHVHAGRAVVVHCGAGLGRTGTVLAAWLASDGMSARAAIRLVRTRRPGSIETVEQEEAVRHAAGGRGEMSTQTIRVLFSGARGRMGRALIGGIAAAEGIELVAEVEREDDLGAAIRASRADVVADFTEPRSAMPNARTILACGARGVIGTTGFTKDDLDQLEAETRAAGTGLLVAPNFALGMVLLQRFAVEAARYFERVEIVESHHPAKLDAPSGTAADTAWRLARAGAPAAPRAGEPSRGLDVEGIRVHSLRLPGVLARQEVHFGGQGETLVLRHDAAGRDCYLPGVLLAIREVPRRVGLLRGLESILFG